MVAIQRDMEGVMVASNRLSPQLHQRRNAKPKYVSQVQIVHEIQKMQMLSDVSMPKAENYKDQECAAVQSPRFGLPEKRTHLNVEKIAANHHFQGNMFHDVLKPQNPKSLSPQRRIIKVTVKPEKITYYRNGVAIQVEKEFPNSQICFNQTQKMQTRPKPSLSPNKTHYLPGTDAQSRKLTLFGGHHPQFPTEMGNQHSQSPRARTPNPHPQAIQQTPVPPKTSRPRQVTFADRQPSFESRFLKRSASRKLKNSNFVQLPTTWAPSWTDTARKETEQHNLLQDPLTKKITAGNTPVSN